jgi:hypothetical protein
LHKVEGKGQFRVEVSNRFSALEDLDTEVEITNAWETIQENIKISAKERINYCELKKHKIWFDEGCSKLLDQRKQAELQWLQDQSEKIGLPTEKNLVKVETGDLLSDSHNILNRWKNYFSELLNVSYVRHIEVHTVR